MIQNPIHTQRALLTWQRALGESGRRDRHPVAELVQHSDGVSFRYLSGNDLSSARDCGFTEYPGIPIDSETSGARALSILMRRLPPLNRVDFGDLLARFGLPDGEYSPLTLLAYTGARMTSDSFAVAETFDGFERPFSYVFDVAGYRHNLPAGQNLADGEPLVFEREPDNDYDDNAIRIARTDGTGVGYVNRLQADAVGRWIDEGRVTGAVFRINGRAEYPRLFVQAEIQQSQQIAAE